MAYCINCGQKLPKGAKFCAECGSAVGNNSETQRKMEYDGEIHKCPNCGDRLDSFITTCPACGYELRGTKVNSVVKELSTKLERIESIEQKIDIIRNFHIPNTKEDICEFFILATSNINANDYDAEAWYAKLEQAYQKANLSFSDSSEFQYLTQLYNKVKKQHGKKAIVRNIKRSKLLQCLLLGAVGIIMMIIGFTGGSISGDEDSPFYMIAVMGFFPIFAAAFYAMSDSKKNSRNNRKKR